LRLPWFQLCKRNDSYKPASVYNRIALFRADRAVSRRDLAEAVGVNPQTIGYLERGDYKPSLELAMKIAAYFGAPIEALFSFTPFIPIAAALSRPQEER
jgi:putative transcriptional regulator